MHKCLWELSKADLELKLKDLKTKLEKEAVDHTEIDKGQVLAWAINVLDRDLRIIAAEFGYERELADEREIENQHRVHAALRRYHDKLHEGDVVTEILVQLKEIHNEHHDELGELLLELDTEEHPHLKS